MSPESAALQAVSGYRSAFTFSLSLLNVSIEACSLWKRHQQVNRWYAALY